MVRGGDLYCVVGMGEYCAFFIDACWYYSSLVFYYSSDVYTEELFWEINVGWVIGVYVDYDDLVIGCL